MNRGAVIAVLSMLFYFSTLLGGSTPESVQTLVPPEQQEAYESFGQMGELTMESVTVRGEPSGQAAAVGVLNNDSQQVLVLDKQDGWYKVHVSSGPTGWVPEHALTIRAAEPKQWDRLILGFYEPGKAAYATLLEHAGQLSATVPLGWSLDSYGSVTTEFDPQEMGRSLYFAGNQELQTFGHVQVSANPSRLLADAYLQERTIEQLENLVEEWGLKGVLLNFSYPPGSEQHELYSFVARVRERLAARGKNTLISLPWQEGLDYAAASLASDYLVLQAFSAPSAPGPESSFDYLEQLLSNLTQVVDSRKIILALRTSGRKWPRTGTDQVISHSEVMELAATYSAKVRWDASSLTPYFHYGDGREVWFENRYSLKHKLELVSKFDLAGAALVNLGQEDPEIWSSAVAPLIS